jgi:Ca-activated chloride channel homolog
MKQIFIFFATCIFLLPSLAQNNQSLSPIIFIYDASGSMWGQIDGKTKMEIASTVLSNSVNQLPENQKIGLVAYGHRKKSDCKDVEFIIDLENVDKSLVIESLQNIKPLGKTPLAWSATQVINKLRETKIKATIILVTDGIESCGGNICDVIKTAREEGIDFKLHIIGFGLKSGETEQLECAAKAGGGRYYDADDAEGLGEVLNEVTNVTVDDPPGNFSVYTIKNGKAIDAHVEAFKAGTTESFGVVRTYKDTAFIYLPGGNYDLKVTPLEGSKVQAITIYNLQSIKDSIVHRKVSFDGGKINVRTLNNGDGWDAVVQIYLSATGAKMSTGRTYGKFKETELNPGIYDVEVKILRIKGLDVYHLFKNIEVKANETINLEHNFKTGILLIGVNSSSGLVDATVKIYDIDANKNVATNRTYKTASSNPKEFIITPGNYNVIIKALGEYKGKQKTITIEVEENKTIQKTITF